jgi:hypothetical protein
VVVADDGGAEAASAVTRLRGAGVRTVVATTAEGVAGVLTIGEEGQPTGRPSPGTTVGVVPDGTVVVRSPAVVATMADAAGWLRTGRPGSIDAGDRLAWAPTPGPA